MCEATAAAIDDGGGRRRWTSAAAVTSTSVLSTATATTDNDGEGERCKGSSRLSPRRRSLVCPPSTTAAGDHEDTGRTFPTCWN